MPDFLSTNMTLGCVYSDELVRPVDRNHFQWLLLNRCVRCKKVDDRRSGRLLDIRKHVIQGPNKNSLCDPFSLFDIVMMLSYIFCYYDINFIDFEELESLFLYIYWDTVDKFMCEVGEDGNIKDLGDVYLDIEETYPGVFRFIKNNGIEYVCFYRRNLEKNPSMKSYQLYKEFTDRHFFFVERVEGWDEARRQMEFFEAGACGMNQGCLSGLQGAGKQ